MRAAEKRTRESASYYERARETNGEDVGRRAPRAPDVTPHDCATDEETDASFSEERRQRAAALKFANSAAYDAGGPPFFGSTHELDEELDAQLGATLAEALNGLAHDDDDEDCEDVYGETDGSFTTKGFATAPAPPAFTQPYIAPPPRASAN